MKTPIDPTYLTLMCDVMGGDSALIDSEIKPLLADAEIEDINPAINRRRRLYNALLSRQEKDKSAEAVLKFIDRVCSHIKLARSAPEFKAFCTELNSALAYSGYVLDDNAKVILLDNTRVDAAALAADERVSLLRTAMAARSIHPEVMAVCKQEFMSDASYHNTVLQAVRIMAEKIRVKAGLSSAGPEVADQAFAMSWPAWPILAITGLKTPEEVSQHYAHLHVIRGILLMFIDDRMRSERPAWQISQKEALDLLSLISFCCTKIDESVTTAR